MTLDTAINGGLLVTPEGVAAINVGIVAGKIATLSSKVLQGKEVIDASGLHLMAGVVDIHVHFNAPGRDHWEGWETGSRSALAGGVTTVVEMPLNSIPSTTNAEALQLKLEVATRDSSVDFALWGGLVNNNIDTLGELWHGGVIGFKAFMSNSGTTDFIFTEDGVLLDGMQHIADLGGFLAVHAESDRITAYLGEKIKGSGRTDPKAWCDARPPEAELEAIHRALFLAKQANCPLHIVHVSIPEGFDLITAAKKQGQHVTAETCAHYLCFTEDDLAEQGAVLKCAPPLRDKTRREKLWQKVLAGEVDCITSDHSPCPTADKAGNIWQAWGGITGVQSLFHSVLTEGLKRGLTLPQLTTLLSRNPAQIASLPRKGEIAVGKDADILLVNVERTFTLTTETLYAKHAHSPFLGMEFGGFIERVFLRGEQVALGQKVVKEGVGHFLQRGEIC